MTKRINWDEVVVYHDILVKKYAIFWMPSKKIYIYELVKKYDAFHEYVLDHEKKHYLNFISNNNIIIKIMLDIFNEWSGSWKITFNEELKKIKKQYLEELTNIKKNQTIINDINIIMEKLCEIKPTRKILLYSKIVEYMRPDSNVFKSIIIFLLLVELAWILNIFGCLT